MTGPGHYREAERLLAEVRREGLTGAPFVLPEDAATVAAAQVHATLALASAAAYPAVVAYWAHVTAPARSAS